MAAQKEKLDEVVARAERAEADVARLRSAQAKAAQPRDPDFSQEKARAMLRQIEQRDYNPPKRERILEWQAQQEFRILPDPDDPECGNLYRSLKFPDTIYNHIEQYQEQKPGVEQARRSQD